MVAYCHPGEIEGLFVDSLTQTLLRDANTTKRITRDGGVMALCSGPRIGSARNAMARAFLADPKKPDWLWMVDSDMTWQEDTLDRLIDVAVTNHLLILGGLCFGGGRSGACFPTLFRLRPPDESGAVVETIEDYPPDALVKVDATGAACLLIHRSALVKIASVFGSMDTPQGRIPSPAPWFMETFYAGREFGEDWTFCMRAAQVDIPVYVHTGIKIGHVKPTLLDETAWSAYLTKRDQLGSREAVVNDYRIRALGKPPVSI
jgi:hypothetical protein